MSILRAANLQFNASGTRRIDYDAVADDGVIKISAAAIKLPVGDTASRPTSQAGIVRYNSDTGYMEFGGATSWIAVASNAAFDVANLAFTMANVAYNAQNVDYTLSNTAFGVANAAYASINSNWTVTNTVYGVANAAFASANNVGPQLAPAYNTANAAFGVANTALQNTSGISFNGNFYIPSGSLGVGNTTPGHAKVHITSANTVGGTGYADFLRVTNASYPAITNPVKTFRLNQTGGLEIINNAYTAVIASLDDSGNFAVGSRGISKASMPAGSVLQVVSVTDRNQSSYTTVDIGTNSNYGYNEAGFDLTTLDIALTPTSSSSKILIMTNINLGSWDQQYGVMRLKRGIGGATPTWSSSDPWMSSGNGVPGTATQLGSYIVTNRATGWQATHIHFQWLDSPGTTSEVKYRFNFRIEADATAATAYLNRAAYNVNDYGSTGAVSSVTLMEIAG